MRKIAALITIPVLLISHYETVEPSQPMGIVAEPIKPVETVPNATVKAKDELTNLGKFTLTAYCSCGKCCGKWADNRPLDEFGNEIVIGATGEVLTAGYSVAVDPNVIPYGTILIINGKEYKAQDTGGTIDGNKIDLYFNDHDRAREFGTQAADVYIKEVQQ